MGLLKDEVGRLPVRSTEGGSVHRRSTATDTTDTTEERSLSTASGKGKQSPILLHRFVMKVTDPCSQVDHFPDSNGLNCQKGNLRIATSVQNSYNQRRRLDNKTGFKGVRRHRNKWRTEVRGQYVGLFSTAKKAALAYDVRARELFGEFAHTNF